VSCSVQFWDIAKVPIMMMEVRAALSTKMVTFWLPEPVSMRILVPFIQIWDVDTLGVGAPAVISMSYSTVVTEVARPKISKILSAVLEGGAEVVVGRVVVEVVGCTDVVGVDDVTGGVVVIGFVVVVVDAIVTEVVGVEEVGAPVSEVEVGGFEVVV